jgi:hypothetical protein
MIRPRGSSSCADPWMAIGGRHENSCGSPHASKGYALFLQSESVIDCVTATRTLTRTVQLCYKKRSTERTCLWGSCQESSKSTAPVRAIEP